MADNQLSERSVTTIDITPEIARKVLDTVDAGLVKGLGDPKPGFMCVEAAVNYALGLKHGDDPMCVSPVLRRLKIGLNDRDWSSRQARAAGLRRLALAQLGSAGVLDEREFTRRILSMTIRKSVPSACRSAAKVNPKVAERLEAAAVRCEQEGSRESALAANEVCREAQAASAAAYAAVGAAAAAAAAYAAVGAAAAAAAAAGAAAAASARDRALAEYAEWVVEILIDMDAPGCQWLDLAPKVA